ncbi:MAG TPA: TlpA family protein disulfide reductase [Kofleriaceae bacterium]|jgi:thiol-disulfide isomerase/thioredoxin
MATRAKRGFVIDGKVIAVGGGVALFGLGLLIAFLVMVPNAAARGDEAACRGLHGFEPVNPKLCKNGDCSLPVKAPDFTALDHQGKPVKLSDFKGKVVLVNFWASWCHLCREEKPNLAQMAADMSSKDYVVIALASDHTWTDVLVSLVDALAPGKEPQGESVTFDQALAAYQSALPNGIPFKVFIDPPAGDGNIGEITSAWGIKAVPESALIDREGNIRAYFVSKRDWTSNAAQTCIRSIIDEK